MVLSEVTASWWRSGGCLNVVNDMQLAVSHVIEVTRTTVPAGTSPALLSLRAGCLNPSRCLCLCPLEDRAIGPDAMQDDGDLASDGNLCLLGA